MGSIAVELCIHYYESAHIFMRVNESFLSIFSLKMYSLFLMFLIIYEHLADNTKQYKLTLLF